MTWSLSAPATFVQNQNNTNLNFNDLVDYYVHHQGKQDVSKAAGVFTHEADGGVWTLDLAQFAGSGSFFTSCDGGTCLAANVTFTYESAEYPAAGTLRW